MPKNLPAGVPEFSNKDSRTLLQERGHLSFHDSYALGARRGYEAGLEAAAKVCDSKERRKWEILAHGGQLEGFGPLDCAAGIRQLKEQK